MPPEAAVDSALPPAEVAAFTDDDGRGSADFERWRALLHPFYTAPPTVEHFTVFDGAYPVVGSADA